MSIKVSVVIVLKICPCCTSTVSISRKRFRLCKWKGRFVDKQSYAFLTLLPPRDVTLEDFDGRSILHHVVQNTGFATKEITKQLLRKTTKISKYWIKLLDFAIQL